MRRAVLAAAGLALGACADDPSSVAAPSTTTATTPTVLGAVQPQDAAAVLQERVEQEVWAMVPSPDSSCLVVDGVFERNADVPVIPASTIKLVVAAAAPEDPRVEAMLVDSDNDAARALVEDLGGPAAIRRGGVEAHDATGHDRRSRVTCRALVDVLTEHPDLPLAVAGRTGTLRDRFTGTPVEAELRAKTGSIRGVSALAGRTDEHVFALVLNDVPTDTEGIAVQDALARALVGSTAP